MESSNPLQLSISFNEAMSRRLKNRERQRRYREKKRRRSASINEQPSQMQIIILPTDVPVVQAVTRTYCKRDWKKDARRVYAVNQEPMSNGIASTGRSLAGIEQVPHSSAGTPETGRNCQSEVPSSEIVRTKLGRRNWKAEARAKRN